MPYYSIATTTDYTMTQVAGSFPFLSTPTLEIYSTRIPSLHAKRDDKKSWAAAAIQRNRRH